MVALLLLLAGSLPAATLTYHLRCDLPLPCPPGEPRIEADIAPDAFHVHLTLVASYQPTSDPYSISRVVHTNADVRFTNRYSLTVFGGTAGSPNMMDYTLVVTPCVSVSGGDNVTTGYERDGIARINSTTIRNYVNNQGAFSCRGTYEDPVIMIRSGEPAQFEFEAYIRNFGNVYTAGFRVYEGWNPTGPGPCPQGALNFRSCIQPVPDAIVLSAPIDGFGFTGVIQIPEPSAGLLVLPGLVLAFMGRRLG
jgi:hypothetical protein